HAETSFSSVIPASWHVPTRSRRGVGRWGMTRRLGDVGEVTRCVESFGDPARPTLLLVSGAAASMDWWDVELCTRLAEGGGGRHVVRHAHPAPGEPAPG